MRRPYWIKAKAPHGSDFEDVSRLVSSARLHTVCASANCPNIGECWGARTATFMILGNKCTRHCRFCAVNHGTPSAVDADEPCRVAEAVAYLKLKHAVITSVTRDDLPDGGAGTFAETISVIRERVPGCSIEVLIPDFQGDEAALRTVVAAKPEVLNHNIETVERCYSAIRPQAIYSRSIALLRRAKEIDPTLRTKSGLMVGVGETQSEIEKTMRDLCEAGVEILTVGQYLAPSAQHAPIARYYTPDEFVKLKELALSMGFTFVESGPLVRSSYRAAEQV